MSQPTPLNFHKDYYPTPYIPVLRIYSILQLKIVAAFLLDKNSLEFNSYYTYKLMYNELIGS